MSHLLLTDDEMALLRWTCELFYVPESPIYFIEAQAREPRDFASTYQDLVRKGVLDDSRFRLSDIALNRLAPLTECDARVVLALPGDKPGRPKAREFYLLDEIAVEYEGVEGAGHSVGMDQDHGELVAGLIKRFMPRRASGDFLNFKVTPGEFLMLSVMCHRARQGTNAVLPETLIAELRPALLDQKQDVVGQPRKRPKETLTDNAQVRHRAAAILAAAPQDPSPAHDVTARSDKPVLEATAHIKPRPAATARLPGHAEDVETLVQPRGKRPRSSPPQDADVADAALAGLLSKGLLLTNTHGVELRPAVRQFALGVSEKSRHSFIRFDFGDDEWFLRETSFLPVEGSLFGLTTAEDGQIQVTELDGRRLETWLGRAVGPLPEAAENTPQKSAKDLILRA